MNLKLFCFHIASIEKLSNLHKALSIIYWNNVFGDKNGVTVTEITKILNDYRLGNPNSTQLKETLKKSIYTIFKNERFFIKADKESYVEDLINIKNKKPAIDISPDIQFLPEELWKNTRGYIEKICFQINGCVYNNFFDAASVLIRRLIETLIIECFEYLKFENKIKDGEGNYFMLKRLIEIANSDEGIPLGRETKKYLSKYKDIGDRSAHNRRYNAIKNDVFDLQLNIRLSIQELLSIAHIK